MEMCELYAKQLAAHGDIRKAVSYLLICGQRSQALELLNLNQLYREATAVNRCLFPDGSQELQESLSRWAGKAFADGNVELAAKCMIANNEIGDAARTLARRLDPAALMLSADLAHSAGLDQLASAYLDQASTIRTSQEVAQESNTEQTQNLDIGGEAIEKLNPENLVKEFQDLAVKNEGDGNESEKLVHEPTIPALDKSCDVLNDN